MNNFIKKNICTILLIIMVVAVSYIYAEDNKKADSEIQSNGQQINELYKK